MTNAEPASGGAAAGAEAAKGGLRGPRARFWFCVFLGAVIAAFLAFRFVYLTADFPTRVTKSGVLYTDEGWYCQNALSKVLTGKWMMPGDLNFAVNLPVLQAFDYIAFKTIGFGIAQLRLVTLAFLIGLFAVLYLLVRRYEDPATALLALAILAMNYLMFVYSRLALAEIPMTFFAVLAMLLASHAAGPRGGAWAAAAGAAFALGLYTKTSAVFAFPIAAAMLAWQGRGTPQVWRHPAIFGGVVAAFGTLHNFALAARFPEDYAYFSSLNVGLNASFSPSALLAQAGEVIHDTEDIDKILNRIFLVVFPLALWLSPEYRRRPLLWLALAWFSVYLAMFFAYGNFKSRYYVPVVPAVAVWAALTMKYFWLRGPRHPMAVLFAIALILSAGRNIAETWEYMANPQYSFAKMAKEIRRIMDADPEANNVLLSHFAATVSLHNRVLPVNDRYGSEPLARRLERYRPSYYASEGGVREDNREVYKTLEELYDMEPIKTFSVFRNYRGYGINLFKLKPKPPAP